MEKNLIKVNEIIENDIIFEFKQSANVLFNFMRELDYLKKILKNKAIIPRYYEESIEYLEIGKIKKIVFPMTCFCDINLNKLESHVEYYGTIGIGLDKGWAIGKGIQPIHYVNTKSDILIMFKKIFTEAFDKEEVSELENVYYSYLLMHLLYIKPLNGKMLNSKKEYINKNFHDEKEWRYIPKIEESDGIELILPSEYIGNSKAYNTYSDGLYKLNHLWLSFDYADIEYLIVENNIQRNSLIDFIVNELDCDSIDKYTLISKISVFNKLKKDW